MNNECRGSHDPDPPEGRYANHFKLGHNAFEFILDFGQFHPQPKGPHYHTRVIASPVYAKSLLQLLQHAVHQYEAAYGAIPKDDTERDRDAD
jgi:hypothetical protein